MASKPASRIDACSRAVRASIIPIGSSSSLHPIRPRRIKDPVRPER
jgi:hypothetical protein